MKFKKLAYQTVQTLRQTFSLLLVLTVAISVICMGGILWVNNSWAVVPDDDPSTYFDISVFFDDLDGKSDLPDMDSDGDGQIPLAGGKLLKGNGDQDDNKHEPILLGINCGSIVDHPDSIFLRICSATNVVQSYVDFGHLKVMPADCQFRRNNYVFLYPRGLSAL